jgi:hypothetical protein
MSLFTTLPGYNEWRAGDDIASPNTVCYPAQPGDPGSATRITTLYQRGWGGGADSITSITGDGFVRFRVLGLPEGIAAGFGVHPSVLEPLADPETGPFDGGWAKLYRPQYIRFGFLFAGTTIRLIVDGVALTTPTIPYTVGQATLIQVTRSGGNIIFQINDWSHTVPNSSTPFVLRAAMFGPADFIEDPVIGGAQTLLSLDANVGFQVSYDGALIARVGYQTAGDFAVNDEFVIRARSGRAGYIVQGGSALQRNLSETGSVGFTAELRLAEDIVEVDLPPLAMLASDYPYCEVQATLPPLQMAADAGNLGLGTDASFTAELTLPPLIMQTLSITGGVINAELTLPPLDALSSDYFYTEIDTSLPPLWTFSDDKVGPDEWFVDETVLVGGFFLTPVQFFATIHDGLQITPTLTVALVFDSAVYDALLLDDTMSFEEVLFAIIRAGLALNSNTLAGTPAEAQYAINLDTGAATRYTNFRFVQYAHTRGATYAARKDGVFVLRPGDDDGDAIDALVRFGTRDFNTRSIKRVDQVYLGMHKVTGQVFVRVSGDGGQEYIYEAVGRTATHRATIGKGIQARHWDMDLILVDAGSAELDFVEFDVSVSPRRW